MNQVRVSRLDLLDRVKKNRDEHKGLYAKAQVGFRARAIEELDDMIRKAKDGDIRLFVGLTPPEDHTAEYDRVIDMLEMSQDDIIEIDGTAFAQLVRNEWQWFGRSTAVNSTYATGGKLGGSK